MGGPPGEAGSFAAAAAGHSVRWRGYSRTPACSTPSTSGSPSGGPGAPNRPGAGDEDVFAALVAGLLDPSTPTAAARSGADAGSGPDAGSAERSHPDDATAATPAATAATPAATAATPAATAATPGATAATPAAT